MKKVIIGVVAIVVVAAIALLLRQNSATPETNNASSSTGNSQATPTPSSTSGSLKDGSYTGDAIPTDRGYGAVQIKAVISGGKITDIVFVQMPSDGGHTQEVTAAAEPILKQEAIANQSSQVDIVSGATQTTQAFQQSLASALAMAK